MSDAFNDDPRDHRGSHWSKNRIEALTDGIYAVAMTLLVIDLKVPDHHAVRSHEDLAGALLGLLPKGGAWLISFFVLAMFWIGHHRLFQHVRVVDVSLLWRNIVQLMLASLLPFSASLLGEFATMREAQFVYNGNMILLALTAAWQAAYVHRHPEMQGRPMTTAAYHAALVRTLGLVACGLVAIAVAVGTGSLFATYAYMAMWPLGVFSRRIAAGGAVPAVRHEAAPRPTDSPPS